MERKSGEELRMSGQPRKRVSVQSCKNSKRSRGESSVEEAITAKAAAIGDSTRGSRSKATTGTEVKSDTQDRPSTSDAT